MQISVTGPKHAPTITLNPEGYAEVQALYDLGNYSAWIARALKEREDRSDPIVTNEVLRTFWAGLKGIGIYSEGPKRVSYPIGDPRNGQVC